jgi:hypothetical protein
MPRVECPSCVAKLDAPAEAEGHTIRCPACGEVFVLRFAASGKTSGAPEPPATTGAATDAFTLSDAPTSTGRPPAKATSAAARPSEPREGPWVILDLAAVLRGMHTIVTCRVENPEAGTLEITLDGAHNSEVIEASLAPSGPTPSAKEFAMGRFPVGTLVSSTLFDADHNARYQAQTSVANNPGDA